MHAAALHALTCTLCPLPSPPHRPVEREWTKALCGGDSGALARLNAAMKRVDLTCLIASPILVGVCMQYGGGRPMVLPTLAILAWNLLAWPPEVALLHYAQRCSPALAADKPAAASAAAAGGGGEGKAGGDVLAPLWRQLRAWGLYAQQPAAAVELALALLYLTVLSFGTLMTAYLAALGLPEAELAVYRG